MRGHLSLLQKGKLEVAAVVWGVLLVSLVSLELPVEGAERGRGPPACAARQRWRACRGT